MIQIYRADNTDFSYNGDQILLPDTCTLEVALNGAWELTLTHPIDEEGRYQTILENAVVKAPSFNGEQLFRIYEKEITDSGVTANARPIFMDSADEVFLVDSRPTGKNGQEALNILTAGTKYSGRSDITKASTAYYVRKNLIEALNSDDEQSFLNRWGGEILFDNYTVIINTRAGGDYGVSVAYGKNLTEIRENINLEAVCTRIVPVAYNGYTLDGQKPWVDSPNVNKYPKIYTRVVEFDDVKLTEDAQEDEESFDTLEALRTELIRRANLMFTEEKVDTPAVSLEVSMAMLQNTEEYKNYQVLETVSLGDTVQCVHSQYKIASEARVVGLTYDCIGDKVESVTLGQFQQNYFDDLSSILDRVDQTIRPNGTIVAERVQGILDGIYTQLRLQSTVAKKVEGRAFLIEDTDPDSDLYGCMIWGTQGLQLAVQKTADGRDWDFTTAITAKGIVADAIITGLLSDKLGRNYWDLDTGEFRLSSEAFKVDDQTVQDYVDGKIDEKVAEIRSLSMVLSNEFQGIATGANGQNGNYDGCYTDVTLFLGTTEITSSDAVNYTINPGAGVVGNWDPAEKRYTVSNLTVNDGAVDISASYLNLTVTRRFTISKVKAGESGEDGRTFFIQPSVAVIKQAANNAFVPESVVFNACYRDGKSAVSTPYSGRWIVEASTDGNVFTPIFAPDYDTPSVMVAPPSETVKIIRATVYAAGGTTNALDIQSITVVRDIDNLTQEEVFNILTNNGQVQGIYMQDGRLYLNAQYMQIGKIADKTGKSYWDLNNGEIVFDGGIINGYHSNGNIGYRLGEGTINFYSRNDPNNVVGAMGADIGGIAGQAQAFVVSADDGDAISLGVGQTNYAEYLQMFNEEITFRKRARFEDGISGDVGFNIGNSGQAYFWNGVTGGGGYALMLKSNVRVYCRQLADPSIYIPISAASFDTQSKKEAKKEIKPFENMTEILRKTDIYEYRLKIDPAEAPKRLGLVIGEGYSVPDILLSSDRDAIDLYSLASLAIAAAKKLYEDVQQLKNQIEGGQ